MPRGLILKPLLLIVPLLVPGCWMTFLAGLGQGYLASNDPRLKVADDAAFVKELREISETSNDTILLHYLDGYEFFLLQMNYREIEERYALASAQTRKRLLQIAESSPHSERGRVAAIILFLGGDPNGCKRLQKMLSQMSDEERADFFRAVTEAFSILDPIGAVQFGEYVRKDGGLSKQLCEYTERMDPALRTAAAKLILRLKPIGWETAIGNVLPKLALDNLDECTNDLAKAEKLENAWAEPALYRIIRTKTDEVPTRLVEEFVRRGAKHSIRTHARLVLQAYLVRQREAGIELDHFGRREIWKVVCAHVGPEDMVWLVKEVEKEPKEFRGPLIAGLTRLKPEAWRPKLLAFLKDETTRSFAIDAIGSVLKNSKDEEVIAALREDAEQRTQDAHLLPVAWALHEMGGPVAIVARNAVLAKVSPEKRQEWSISMHLDGGKELRRLYVDSGWLTADEFEKAYARSVDQKDFTYMFFEAEQPESLLVAAIAGRAFVIKEEPTSPLRHDAIVWRLAKLSQGKLKLESIAEATYDSPRDQFRQLSFVIGNRGYRIALRGAETIPDFKRLLQLMNRACADAGLTERYVALDAGPEETVLVVFGPPEGIQRMGDARGFKTCDDPDERFRTPSELDARLIQEMINRQADEN